MLRIVMIIITWVDKYGKHDANPCNKYFDTAIKFDKY